MTTDVKISPMMAQWHDCKTKAKDAVLLFRLGDFYECFYDDAIVLSRELDLTLTKRNEIPMSGIPQQTIEGYIDKLIAKGHKVAIAEQVEDARQVKGLVKREIVRIITPGTIINSNLLAEKANNYLVSLTQINECFGLAILDLTTGAFRVIEITSIKTLFDELCHLHPSELIVSEKCRKNNADLVKELKSHFPFILNVKEEWQFDHRTCLDALLRHFRVHSLDGFGLQGMISAINAAGALLTYISDELHLSIDHIDKIERENLSQYMALDSSTQRHLELTSSDNSKATLFHLLDHTSTPMGGRLLKQWITHPLLCVQTVNGRLDATAEFIGQNAITRQITDQLEQIRDLERLITRVSTGYASPKDCVALRLSLECIPQISLLLQAFPSELILHTKEKLVDVIEVREKIATALVDDPPYRLSDGGLFKKGYSDELDELITFKTGSKEWLVRYQESLRSEVDIKTLKIGYTKAFGYYIEVSRAQSEKMPPNFERKQTLVNAERFISPELKDYEHKVLTAEERISILEAALFQELKEFIAKETQTIKQIANAIAVIDCLTSFAEVSVHRRYTRPIVDESDVFEVEDGRHPIIEASLSEDFIPNNIELGGEDKRLLLITGPNMAGKSTYLRQAALIAIMAQIGCYVPAKSAHLGLIDKVFSRIGATDDLTRGKSTFMVEMSETANILNNATERSLIILDEIGRGTSTYDGISIAWAVADYLLTNPEKRAKTLFATHYYELTDLEKEIPGVVNFHVAVHEADDEIVFLRKINRGATDKSYGIHVARLAGLPAKAIKRAQEILRRMENLHEKSKVHLKEPLKREQLLLFSPPSQDEPKVNALLTDLKQLDLDNITPMQAHQKLSEYKHLLPDV